MAAPPWQRPRPPGAKTKLDPDDIAWARERARKAGRRYPNLVDNMAAAQRKRRRVTRGRRRAARG